MPTEEKTLLETHELLWYADFSCKCELQDSRLVIQCTAGKWTINLTCPFGSFGRAWSLKEVK